jgi:hypothetical protein
MLCVGSSICNLDFIKRIEHWIYLLVGSALRDPPPIIARMRTKEIATTPLPHHTPPDGPRPPITDRSCNISPPPPPQMTRSPRSFLTADRPHERGARARGVPRPNTNDAAQIIRTDLFLARMAREEERMRTSRAHRPPLPSPPSPPPPPRLSHAAQ